MSIKIAVSGKGGVGKTTITALIISSLLHHKKTPVLAIDADPNSNLNDYLGLIYEHTVADIREDIREKDIPSGMSKSDFIDMQLQASLTEGEGIDLLVMGRPEGRGCYCYVNELLRTYISRICKNYPYIIMDNEAGMEHLSRRTTDDLDVLLIVADSTRPSLVAAERIYAIAQKVKLKIRQIKLVLNRVDSMDTLALNDLKIPLAGIIPLDEQIFKFSQTGSSLINVDVTNPVVIKINQILTNLISSNGV